MIENNIPIIYKEQKKFESIYIQDPKSFFTIDLAIILAKSSKKGVNQLILNSFMTLSQFVYIRMNNQMIFLYLIFIKV